MVGALRLAPAPRSRRFGTGCDALAYRRWLIARGWNAITDELAGREIDRRLNAGEKIVCIELPYLEEEQEMPW
ncbi:MAG: hypothetical protein KatS3mg108_0719 [Isosphaeraceae bacterium]|nr:MAG: hypothetical protein KatS3mg108_0719 [Isosphaeraceae bacterium]